MSKIVFKIDDLYAMPDSYRPVLPWYKAWSAIVRGVFGMRKDEIVVGREDNDPYSSDYDEAAEDEVEEAGRIKVHPKMDVWSDDEEDCAYFTSIYVLSLDGTPYGAFVGSGGWLRSGNKAEFFVTDKSLYRSSIRIAEQFRKDPIDGYLSKRLNARIVDENFDLAAGADLGGEEVEFGPEDLRIVGRCFIVKRDGGFSLVSDDLTDSDGTLLFDNSVFSRALTDFSATWGYIKVKPTPNADVDRMLSELAAIIADAIPEGVRRVAANEPFWRLHRPWLDLDGIRPDASALGLKPMWIAAIAGTDKGTYALGILEDDLQFRQRWEWTGRVYTRHLGGPVLFARFEERYGCGQQVPCPNNLPQ